MTDLLEYAVPAFSARSSPHIASFDRTALVDRGEWTVADDVDVAAVVRQCKRYDELTASGTVYVPLHEPDSAEIDGEYVEYADTQFGEYLIYEGPEGKRNRVSLSSATDSVVAHRMRFWLAERNPPETPSYVGAGDTAEALAAEPIAPITGADANAWFGELRDFVNTLESQQRRENWNHYREKGFYAHERAYGGIDELVASGTTSTGKHSRIYLYAAPAEDEDDPDPLDLVADYGLYPNMEVLVDLDWIPDTLPEGMTAEDLEDRFPARGAVAFWNEDNRTVGLRLLDAARSDAILDAALTSDAFLFRVVGLLNRVPFARERDAIGTVERDERKRAALLGHRALGYAPDFSIRSREATPPPTDDEPEPDPVTLYDTERTPAVVGGIALNEYQAEAAELALRSKGVYCIHGPPGTGKTRTLNAIVRQTVAEGKRVLACAHSNQAVDNLLVGDSAPDDPDSDSLHALAQDDSAAIDLAIARTGTGCENRVVREHYLGASVSDADVVGATTSSADSFDPGTFDLAIVDEATQASIPATLVPYSCADRLVLAGDHHQLPPYKSTEAEERPIHVSLFEHLLETYNDGIQRMLRRQYRMNAAIAAFPSKAFYDDLLETDERNAEWTVPGMEPLVGFDVTGPEESAGTSKRNDREARVAAKQVERLVEQGVPMSDIGVITPYTAQVGHIRRVLDEHVEGRTQYVTVDTVDAFQGGEREAIVVSFVRSNDSRESGFLTFPDEGPRRLNVALTRAKKHLTIIGDFDTLGRTPAYRDASESCSEVYAALADHLRSTGAMFEPGQKSSQGR